jgi:hypothetical protein
MKENVKTLMSFGSDEGSPEGVFLKSGFTKAIWNVARLLGKYIAEMKSNFTRGSNL